jgi:hypothetical protein
MSVSLYEQVLGSRFAELDEPVQRFHRLRGRHELHGSVKTQAPATLPARLLGRLLGTPMTSATGPIRFELDAQQHHEVWTRHFPTRLMTSTMRREGPYLIERLGPARLTFRLEAEDGKLSMRLVRMHVLGVPCPAWARPRIVAEETGDAGLLCFDVRASLPLIGEVARYAGALRMDSSGAS